MAIDGLFESPAHNLYIERGLSTIQAKIHARIETNDLARTANEQLPVCAYAGLFQTQTEEHSALPVSHTLPTSTFRAQPSASAHLTIRFSK